MYSKSLLALLIAGAFSCNDGKSSGNSTLQPAPPVKDTLKNENVFPTIGSINLPPGYKRIAFDDNSFAAWLRNIGLKKDRTVFLFNGQPKANQSAQFAVIDISTGNKNLQQCADAVMRLRAEYLFAQNWCSEINFRDNEGREYQFTPPYTRNHFTLYLETVFGMCGSASLSKQLKPASIQNIEPGDVFIHGGFPGHAEIVTDVAINKEGRKIYMLAQSYMPAQDIHILINPDNTNLSPWYEVNDNTIVNTPEYSFTKDELKRW